MPPSNEAIIHELVDQGHLVIDSQCRIWRVKDNYFHAGTGKIEERVRPRRKLATVPDRSGTLKVQRRVGDKVIRCSAHRLVWFHHHGEIPEGMAVVRKPGAKSTSNLIGDLELAPLSEVPTRNSGLIRANSGAKHPAAKLNEAQVRRIRRLYAKGGTSYEAIANRFDVSTSAVRRIVTGEQWKSVAAGGEQPGGGRERTLRPPPRAPPKP